MTIPPSEETLARKHWMSVLARASAEAIGDCLRDAPALPEHVTLRGPETGLVMLRGRAGGGGAARLGTPISRGATPRGPNWRRESTPRCRTPRCTMLCTAR
jgi:hypothetical protein